MHSFSARRISDEPIVNFVHRHVMTMILVLYVLGLLYMSFVPFDFTLNHHAPRGMRALSGMSLSIFAISDLLVNVVIYMPLGFLAMMAMRRIGFGKSAAMLSCVGFGTLLSFAIEKGQGWTLSRVSAWSDVMANSIGTFLGIIAYLMLEPGLRGVLDHVRVLTRRNVWLMGAQVLVAAILLTELRPYDVAVDPARAVKALKNADPAPMARWSGLPAMVKREIGLGRRASMTELPRVQWDYALDCAGTIVLYGVLAAVLAIGLARSGKSLVSTLLSTGTTVAAVGGTVTVFRVFLISHGLDTMHLCCALVGWPVGCAVGWMCQRCNPRTLSMGSVCLLMTALTLAILHEIAPGQWGPRHGSISLVPFLRHFGSRVNDAFLDISGDVLRYGLLAMIAASCVARAGNSWQNRSVLIVAGVTILAASMEMFHLWIPFRQADMTSVYLALVSSSLAVVAVRWAQDYCAGLVMVALDPLTGALMDGPSYDKDALTRGLRRSDASRKDQAVSLPPV